MSNVGKIMKGFCNGFFGRDSYSDKRIEAEGTDWIVAREIEEPYMPMFAGFSSEDEKNKYILEWSK